MNKIGGISNTSFPKLTCETERGAQSEMVKLRNQKLTTSAVGNKKQILLDEVRISPGN